ncbi:hypothetical protein ACJX0J_040292, partial [Zea mays]
TETSLFLLTSNQGTCVASSQMACSWLPLMLPMRMWSCSSLQKVPFLVKEYGSVPKKKRTVNLTLHHQIRIVKYKDRQSSRYIFHHQNKNEIIFLYL